EGPGRGAFEIHETIEKAEEAAESQEDCQGAGGFDRGHAFPAEVDPPQRRRGNGGTEITETDGTDGRKKPLRVPPCPPRPPCYFFPERGGRPGPLPQALPGFRRRRLGLPIGV